MSKVNKTARIQTTDPLSDLELIRANLAKLKSDAESIDEQAKRLEAMLKNVKATREIKPRIIDPLRPFFVGADADTDHLYDAVKRCIGERPRTLRELVELTGETNRNRVGGALVKFQVDGLPVQNLGTKYRALWWLPRSSKKG